MTDKPDRIVVNDLVNWTRQGRLDVLEFQRIFNRDVAWVRDLIDSLHRGIPINSLLLWDPAACSRPSAGRYQDESHARSWIVDGQQRVMAILAALGIRPPWIPETKWLSSGGDRLVVLLTTNQQEQVAIAERQQHGPCVSLAELFAASEMNVLPDAVGNAGFPDGEGLALEFDRLLRAILNAPLLLEWMPGNLDDAFLAFKRHNSRSTQLSLKQEELELSLLASRFGPLLRDYIDPTLKEASAYYLSKTFTRKRVNNALQRFLPPGQRKLNAARADAATAEDAADRIRRICPAVMRYLHEHGLVHDELISTPAIVDVLIALFDRVPHARTDSFPMRWITHVVAGNLFFGRPSTQRLTLKMVRHDGTYEQIQAGIAAQVPVGRPTVFTEERLHPTPKPKSTFGGNGCLFALASAHPTGRTRDLAVDDVRYPHPEMRLRPLCADPIRGLLVHHTLMTDQTAEIIASHGGWTRAATEELKPDDESLTAHCLTVPPRELDPGDVAAWLQEHRTPMLAQRIDAFLDSVGPLREAPDPGLPS